MNYWKRSHRRVRCQHLTDGRSRLSGFERELKKLTIRFEELAMGYSCTADRWISGGMVNEQDYRKLTSFTG